jgi:hypothetical protein
MVKLEGIIYSAFGSYIVIRGFAKISDLAKVSHRPTSYQRIADDKHKREIIDFLKEGKYAYFPELVLAYRAEEFAEFDKTLNSLVTVDNDIDWNAEKYVKGLKVLKETLPTSGYRARHANLMIADNELIRIDGNHRLEPFDESDDWWWEFVQEPIPDNQTEEEIKQ